MRYCTQCGTAARTEQAFCIRCGTQLGLPAEPQALAPATGSGPCPGPAEPDPPALATSRLYRDPEPGPPTAAWVPSESAGAGPQPPASSWQPSAAADTGPAWASSWPSPSPGGGQDGPQADSRQPGRRRGSRAGAAIAITAIVLVLGGGVAAGWKLLGHTAAGTVRPQSASTGAAAPPGTASPTSRADGAQGAGQLTVAIAPTASQQTNAPQVAAFLQTYFQAINTRDYSSYSYLFEPELRPTLQQFQNGYGSTHDSGAVLTDVSLTPVGLAAVVSFTSHQQPGDSATGTSCTSWDITLYLKPHGSTYWIVHPPANYHAHYHAC